MKIIFISSCLIFNVYHLNAVLSMYDRSVGMLDWEKGCLNELVQQYDGPNSRIGDRLYIEDGNFFSTKNNSQKLIDLFIKCLKGENIELHSLLSDEVYTTLKECVNNIIGRETIYRIIAKILPRMQCIELLSKEVNDLSKYVNLEDKVKACISIFARLGVLSGENSSWNDNIAKLASFSTSLDISGNNFLSFLLINPSWAFLDRAMYNDSYYLGLSDLISKDSQSWESVVNVAIEKLCIYVIMLFNSINELRLQFIYNPRSFNHYDHSNNSITITGTAHYANIITGPILNNTDSEPLYVDTDLQPISRASILNHELGHYLHLKLENFVSDNSFSVLSTLLFYEGISSDYIKTLSEIWTNSEELREIFGIMCIDNSLSYDHLNQSEFNLFNGDGIRYAHCNRRCHTVPYKLFNIVFGERGENSLKKKFKFPL